MNAGVSNILHPIQEIQKLIIYDCWRWESYISVWLRWGESLGRYINLDLSRGKFQDRINYSRILLGEMSMEENEEEPQRSWDYCQTGMYVELQMKEQEKEGWEEASQIALQYKEGSARLVKGSLSQSQRTKVPHFSQEWACFNIPVDALSLTVSTLKEAWP